MMLCGALICAGCPSSDGAQPAAGSASGDDSALAGDDSAVATQLLAGQAALPHRSKVVALTNRLAIAASETKDDSASTLRLLAARLRERIWRFDRSSTDAREAIELYGAVVDAAAGSARSCMADLHRARLGGEMARDAAQMYRGLYLALERQSAAASDEDGYEPCMTQLRAMLAQSESFRPQGMAWRALQREAIQQVSAMSATLAPSAAAATASTATPSASADLIVPPGEGEILVVPEATMVKKGKKKLTKVQPYGGELGGRVVLHLDGYTRYETGILEPDPAAGRPHRVYLDLFDARYRGLDDNVASEGLVQRVRLGKRKFGTRVVLDLKEAASRRVFYLPDPFRVVIDVSTRKPTVMPKGRAQGKRYVRRVALDPGHGGWDAGAIGPTGLREKDVALDVAHRAAPALASELGVETMLTRDTDEFIELDHRTARANAFQSDIFISIHCNATENGQASGLEVFVLDPSKEQDAETLRVIARENHAHRGDEHRRRIDVMMLDSQLTNIAAGLGVGRTLDGSRVFADLLRISTMGSLGERFPDTIDHGTKTAAFYVLVGAEMPAVLFETAFISNPDDESRLSTADYRQKLADSIVNAVRAYRDGIGPKR